MHCRSIDVVKCGFSSEHCVCTAQETVEATPVAGPDALLKDKIKQKRHREGYEEGVSVMHRPTSAASFVAAERPVEALGRFTRCGLGAHSSCNNMQGHVELWHV